MRQGRARARRRDRHELRPAPRLPASARVDRRPARRPRRVRDGHERLAPGLQLHRAPPRPGGHQGVRGGPVLRPLAPDPAPPRRRGRGRSAHGRGRGRGRARRGARPDFGPEPRLHDPDVPEPERPHALRAEPPAPARGGALARRDGARGRSLRPPPLRRGVAAAADRALRRRRRHVPLVVLEDGCPGDQGRLRDPSRGAHGRHADARVRELRLAGDVRRGDAARVRRCAGSSTRTWRRSGKGCGRGATR